MKRLLLALSLLPTLAHAAVSPWVFGSDNKSTNLQTGLSLPQASTPAGNPPAGRDYLYFKSDNLLYQKTPAGVETAVGTGGGGGTGTVTTASVVTANGFAGTVANPTTTPAFTLSTSVTGILKGNGTAVSAAAVTDFPAQFINSFVNPDFYLWTRGTSVTVANTVSTYQADQWYVKNSLGTNGVITYSQNATAVTPSVYAAQVKITTAPTAAQTNGTELYGILGNDDSENYYNATASMSVSVKAITNVTQVGIQFFYATTEVKLTTAIGSETLCAVNSSTYSLCAINGQALGTSQTAAGVIGVRIRITAVSSGNTYDINNGFIVSQAQLNPGAAVAGFYKPPLSEVILSAQRQVYGLNAPPFNIANGQISTGCFENTTTTIYCSFIFPTIMRAVPTTSSVQVTGFKVSDANGSQSISATAATVKLSQNGAILQWAGSGFTAALNAIGMWAVSSVSWLYFDAGI